MDEPKVHVDHAGEAPPTATSAENPSCQSRIDRGPVGAEGQTKRSKQSRTRLFHPMMRLSNQPGTDSPTALFRPQHPPGVDHAI